MELGHNNDLLYMQGSQGRDGSLRLKRGKVLT